MKNSDIIQKVSKTYLYDIAVFHFLYKDITDRTDIQSPYPSESHISPGDARHRGVRLHGSFAAWKDPEWQGRSLLPPVFPARRYPGNRVHQADKPHHQKEWNVHCGAG